MVSLNVAINCILEGFVTDKFRFLLIEVTQEFLHKLLPVKDMLSDLSVQLINSSPLYLWTDTLFIYEFAKLILNPSFDLLNSREQDIINLYFNNIDIGLIESLMLTKDLSNSIMNHFLMLLHHYGVFKVFSNQFLGELKEEDVLIPLLKVTVLSEPHIAIRKLPEFLGKLEPRFKGIRGSILLATVLHES